MKNNKYIYTQHSELKHKNYNIKQITSRQGTPKNAARKPRTRKGPFRKFTRPSRSNVHYKLDYRFTRINFFDFSIIENLEKCKNLKLDY